MYQRVEQRLRQLGDIAERRLLTENLYGLEKECLRVTPDGTISQTQHPASLGSALTHPYITTDYSEALIEFVTPPMQQTSQLLEFLSQTQSFVYSKLDNELLWATSMPCVVAGETSIRIAKYGTSNPGMMKTVYRRGLGHRYGRVMQVIAGVHFNYSFADALWPVLQEIFADQSTQEQFRATSYFALLRNLQRFGWLIPYLFGASPAICKSFLHGQETSLKSFNASTYYEPYATSLRMGDIGYQNNKENEHGIKANYDSLKAYVDSLTYAINTPCPEYEEIGVVVNGVYEQLNANILQIENEYYSTVRPKQISEKDEKPTLALMRRGVRYVELRSLDVNAFHPLGVAEEQLYFLQILMLFCLLHDSPLISEDERKEIDRNEMLTAHQGRDPNLNLARFGKPISIKEWGSELLGQMQLASELLDRVYQTECYSHTLARQQLAIKDPGYTPSARMLQEMRDNNEGFFQFAMRMSKQHQAYFRQHHPSAAHAAMLANLTKESLQQQQQIEQADSISFADYLARYFAQQ